MTLLKLEFYKCRRRHVALVCAAVLGAELCWMGAFFARQTPEEMTAGWMLLLYNLAMVDAIILPISVAVLASRNCELEHKGSSWKLLETMASPGSIYTAKFLWGAWCWGRCWWPAAPPSSGWARPAALPAEFPGAGSGCSL